MAWAYREFIAFTCGERYSMPLGVVHDAPGFFRVYRGTGLYERYKGGLLVLLAPVDPLDFYRSIRHELELLIDYESGCPMPDAKRGSWFTCPGVPVGEAPEYRLYECEGPRPLLLAPWTGYSRAYGCLVELLVMATKAIAGVDVPRSHVDGLVWCIRRSAPGDPRLEEALDWALQALRGNL